MQSIDTVVDFLVVQVGSVVIPQLLLVAWTPLLTCPLVCNNRCWVLIVLGRAQSTGTRPGLTPAIRAEKGCRGRREFLPSVLPPKLGACFVDAYGESHTSYTQVRTTTNHHTSCSVQNSNPIWEELRSIRRGASTPLWELKHALSEAGGPTQSQQSRLVSPGHHISVEHRTRRKHPQ